jgi:hypothetical protein
MPGWCIETLHPKSTGRMNECAMSIFGEQSKNAQFWSIWHFSVGFCANSRYSVAVAHLILGGNW